MDYEKQIKTSWSILKKDIWTYIAATFILMFGSIFLITAAPLMYGYYVIIIRGLRNEEVSVINILEGFKLRNFFRSWIAMLIITIPLIIFMFISNALTYAVYFCILYTMPLLVIRGYGGIAACKESVKIAFSHPLETVLLVAVNIGLPYIGILFFIVGVFITTPYIEILITSSLFELLEEKHTDEIQEKTEVMQAEAGTI